MERGLDSSSREEREPVEPIDDIEVFRKAMAGVWHEEFTQAEVRAALEEQEEVGIQESVRKEHLYDAQLGRTAQQKRHRERPEGKPFTELVIASGNARKQQFAKEGAVNEGVHIRPYTEPAELEGAEQKAHVRLQKQIAAEQEKPDTNESHVASFTAALYALEVAGQKAKHILAEQRDCPVLAFDVVVLQGDTILEKPKTKEDAVAILRGVAGGEIEVSFGAVMQVPTSFGRVATQEAGRMRIALRDVSDSDIDEYFANTGEAYKNIAGGVDWSDARAQVLIDIQKPVTMERIQLEGGNSSDMQHVDFSPELLPQMPDYLVGTPKELVQELVRRGKILSE